MSIFQSSVVTKHLKTQNKEKIAIQWELFKNHFHNPRIQEEIKSLKEEQYQGEFLEDLFVKILGYTKPASSSETKFNLTTEYKNVKDSKKADGAIVVNDVVKAVIELKGTNTTDLGKIEVQAFGYKNNQPECTYVITSNFEKLRFYIDNAIEHIEFNLFTLTEKDFELLYLCLAFENIQNDIPKNIKKESISQEDAITKKLYNDYSLFKRELHQSLVILNPQFDALTLYQKSQKLLDRFLFLFFAEDRQLLPPNSVRLILNQWKQLKELDAYSPLFDRFKKYFGYLNTGFKGKQYDVYAYNGGLFLPDEVLDNITIDDDLLYLHTLKLSEYDFISEVDVNILGHIFENSLNELDEIKAQLEGQAVDKSKTKRKKDGVFYTPKYITKYIVENTVGKLCEEKKAELEIVEDDYITDRKRQKKTIKILLDKLTEYRNWLLQLTICDPACGSGAFLNQALDFLILEHKYIDELQAKLFGDAMVLSDVEKSILENNLFGVDLNEESVEIAKLSLWLRTAQPNRKLNDLNNNIKCGNSLIDDVEIAGEKAFNWQQEFPQIFAKGGFDVVIGNPPYVRHELLIDIKEFLSTKFSSYQSTADLYVYFIEKGFDILKYSGLLGYITPNKFIQSTYGKKLREFLSKTNILYLIDFGELPVFQDAATFPMILIIEKDFSPSNKTCFTKIKSLNNLDLKSYTKDNYFNLSSDIFLEENWVLASSDERRIFDKISTKGICLGEYLKNEFYRGILTGYNEAFIINEDIKNLLINKHSSAEKIIKPFVDGDDVRKYYLHTKNKYLIFCRRGINIDDYPSIKEYLSQFRENLEPKKNKIDKRGRKKGDYKWYEIQDSISYYKEFDLPKIIYPEIAMSSRFTIDYNKTYLNKTIFFIPSEDKFLLSILNSKLIWFYLVNVCTRLGDPKNGGRLNLQKIYLKTIPIINIEEKNPNKQKTINYTEQILILTNKLQEIIQKFQRTLEREFELDSLSNKLQDWYLLAYGDFIKELEKKKVKLSLAQKAEWEDYFLQESKKALALKTNIDTTDKEIDQMVYQLYGLTEEEIEIVENS